MANYRGLEALKAFVECGSVSAAADRMARTQPQVGRLLSTLEKEVGFPLFVRKGQRLMLTPEGRQFYIEADRVLSGHRALDRFASLLRQAGRNHVRILSAPYVTSSLVLDAIATMAHQSPEFTASLDVRVRVDIETWVTQESFDLGLTVLPLAHPAFEVEELIQIDAVVCMRYDHPLASKDVVTVDDILDHPLIMTHTRSIMRIRVEEMYAQRGVTPRVRFETTNGLNACQLAARGLGVCVSDAFVARSSGASDMVMRRFEPNITLTYGFLYPTWQSRSEAVNALSTHIADNAREQSAYIQTVLDGDGRQLPYLPVLPPT